MSKQAENLRANTVDELKTKVVELKKEQFNLRFQRASGELENTARMHTFADANAVTCLELILSIMSCKFFALRDELLVNGMHNAAFDTNHHSLFSFIAYNCSLHNTLWHRLIPSTTYASADANF